MSLATARSAIATALDTLTGVTAYARPVATPAPLDAWVVITQLAPGDFTSTLATFTAVIFLGSDEAQAEEWFESLGVAAIDAVTKADSLNATDVSLEAQALIGSGTVPGPLYVLALALTVEV